MKLFCSICLIAAAEIIDAIPLNRPVNFKNNAVESSPLHRQEPQTSEKSAGDAIVTSTRAYTKQGSCPGF